MNNKIGTLYGIGVGPGDPELITLKAIQVLKKLDVVFTASSTKNNYSIALDIASHYIPKHTPIVKLAFPMTQDKADKKKAWQDHAKTVLAELENGKDAAFLTVGDPLTYSTFGYLLQNIRAIAPNISIQTVPGITSYQAAAACTNTPLVEGEESLLLTSGAKGGDHVRHVSEKIENFVLLKAYRNVDDIVDALEKHDMLENSVAVTNCGLPEQKIFRNIKGLKEKPPEYWTLVIAKKKKN